MERTDSTQNQGRLRPSRAATPAASNPGASATAEIRFKRRTWGGVID